MKQKNRKRRHLINDSVLLKIHREFGHDEAVKALEAEISSLRFENGVLKSEKAELEDENTKFKKIFAAIPQQVLIASGGTPITLDEDPRIPEKIKKELKKLRQDVKEWRDKFFQAQLLLKKNES